MLQIHFTMFSDILHFYFIGFRQQFLDDRFKSSHIIWCHTPDNQSAQSLTDGQTDRQLLLVWQKIVYFLYCHSQEKFFLAMSLKYVEKSIDYLGKVLNFCTDVFLETWIKHNMSGLLHTRTFSNCKNHFLQVLKSQLQIIMITK